MKSKKTKLIIIISVCALLTVAIIGFLADFTARTVFLSPSCYSESKNLTENENYFIKKIVLEAVEDRLSVLADGNSDIYDPSATDIEVIQLDPEQEENRHLFVFINRDFMKSAEKIGDEYIVYVQTYNMEEVSSDCVYEIDISEDFTVTFFGLDP